MASFPFFPSDVPGTQVAALKTYIDTAVAGTRLTGTATWDPASVAVTAGVSTTVTVTGAAVGDVVGVGFSTAVPAGLILSGQVTSADTVTVSLYNAFAATTNLTSGTLQVDVWHG